MLLWVLGEREKLLGLDVPFSDNWYSPRITKTQWQQLSPSYNSGPGYLRNSSAWSYFFFLWFSNVQVIYGFLITNNNQYSFKVFCFPFFSSPFLILYILTDFFCPLIPFFFLFFSFLFFLTLTFAKFDPFFCFLLATLPSPLTPPNLLYHRWFFFFFFSFYYL